MAVQMLKHFPTGKEFAQNFNADACRKRYAAFKTPKQALVSGKIKLSHLAQAYSEKLILSWIKTWLIHLSSFMDFDLTEQQANETAFMMLEELYMLNMAEWTLFFRRLKKGVYGTFYGKFNGQTILIACKEYRMERGKEFSKLSSEEQNKI